MSSMLKTDHAVAPLKIVGQVGALSPTKINICEFHQNVIRHLARN